MKFLAVLLVVAVAQAKVVPYTTAHGYLKNSIARAESLRAAEEAYLSQRIVGGAPSGLGMYPYQAGLISEIVGSTGSGVCGGSLLSANAVVTAAHCWFDGANQAWRFTVVLGTVTLFTGGTRLQSTDVTTHSAWVPSLVRNDVAVIRLPTSVSFSDTISPIALPSGSELNDEFVGANAIASGFGLTSDDGFISTNQFLSHVNLRVISNSACSVAFPILIQTSNICTSGLGGISTCRGDSGGPLVVTSNNRNILIGITSFGSALGCQANMPAVFARTTSYVSFLNQFLN